MKKYSFMSTRAQVRFATREEGVTFSEHPNAIHAQFYVHSEGYPEGESSGAVKNLTMLEAIDFTKATTKASKIGYKAPGQ